MFKTTAWNKFINSNCHYAYCLFTDGMDLHVESLDSGGTSAVPSEVVAEPSSDAEVEPEGLLTVISGYLLLL